MLSERSRKEWVLLAGVAGSAVVLVAMVIWAAWLARGMWPLLFLGAPSIVIAVVSVLGLVKRSRFGAWGALLFFALQTVVVQRDGAQVWPGFHVGLDFVVHQDSGFVVSVSLSSIAFAVLALLVIRQFWEARIVASISDVAPLLPPNTSLERTRER